MACVKMLGSSPVAPAIPRSNVTPFALAHFQIIRLTVFIRRALKGDIRPFSTVLELAGTFVVAMKFRLVSTDIRQGRAWREVPSAPA